MPREGSFSEKNVHRGILPAIMDSGAVKIEADKIYCIPHEIDGQTVYTEITITAKNWTDTKRSKAYNPREKVAQIEAKMLAACDW